MARKTKYTEDFPLLAEGYAREGMIDKDIAAKLGIGEKTFYRYLKKHGQFRQAIARGKAPVDFEVENLLLKRCRGFEYEEMTVEYDAAVEVEGEKAKKATPRKIKKITKQVIPDIDAHKFWLKNRKPKKWRDKQNIELSGEDGEPVKIEYVPVKKRKREDDNKAG